MQVSVVGGNGVEQCVPNRVANIESSPVSDIFA